MTQTVFFSASGSALPTDRWPLNDTVWQSGARETPEAHTSAKMCQPHAVANFPTVRNAPVHGRLSAFTVSPTPLVQSGAQIGGCSNGTPLELAPTSTGTASRGPRGPTLEHTNSHAPPQSGTQPQTDRRSTDVDVVQRVSIWVPEKRAAENAAHRDGAVLRALSWVWPVWHPKAIRRG